MGLTMRVCVYCASSAKAASHYGEAAFLLGKLLATNDIHVLFGGGGIGSMAKLADGVNAVGGKITGVMPHFMRDLEWAHPEVRSFLWTADMAERKARLMENTDAVIALPGGCGTFEELLEVITLKRLGIYLKPIVIVNQERFYDPLIALFRHSVNERFMDERHLEMFSVVTDVGEVLEAINNAAPWGEESRNFAAQV